MPCGCWPSTRRQVERHKENRVKLRTVWLPFIGYCALSVIACGGGAEPQQSPRIGTDNSALDEFAQGIDAYAAMRRRIAGPFGAIDETKSPQEINDRGIELSDAIGKARADARQGDIFAPGAAAILKTRIKDTYKSSPQVRDTRQDAEIEVPDFVPQVNMVYPVTFPLATFPPTLLIVLPELPDELEYRIVTHHLILRDVEANTILDVLPNAIP